MLSSPLAQKVKRSCAKPQPPFARALSVRKTRYRILSARLYVAISMYPKTARLIAVLQP